MSLYVRIGNENEFQKICVNDCFLRYNLTKEENGEQQVQCYFQFQEIIENKDRKIYLTECDESDSNAVIFAHSGHCPFLSLHEIVDKTVKEEVNQLQQRGIDIASCLVIERKNEITKKSEVLITKRNPKMRAFPNVWVVPGGHVEFGERLIESAIRELKEEVGIDLSHVINDCEERIQCIGVWESVFPSQLQFGYPKRHHFVAYFHIQLTEEECKSPLYLHADEVEIAAWIDVDLAYSLVTLLYPLHSLPPLHVDVELLKSSYFDALFVESNSSVLQKRLPIYDHLGGKDCSIGKERISTSTLFILSRWVQLTLQSPSQ